MSLTTRNNVKEYLGIAQTDDTYDKVIDVLIPRCDAIIKDYVRCNLERQTITAEYHSGDNSGIVALRNIPVISITTMHEDSDGYFGRGSNAFGSADLLTEATDYVLDYDDEYPAGTPISMSGHVLFLNGGTAPLQDQSWGWPRGIGNIKVAYVAGYVQLPDPIVMAATRMVAEFVSGVRQNMSSGFSSGPIVEQRLGDYVVRYEGAAGTTTTFTVQLRGIPEEAAGMLDKWRRVRVV